MSAALQTARRIGLRQRLATTPGRLMAGMVAVILVAVASIAVNLAVEARTAQAVQTLGSDAEPSVVLALRISTVLADLDATAAEDVLTGGPSAAGSSAHWRSDKAELDGLVVQAARNITYPAETDAIQGLLRWVGEYQASLAEVRGVANLPWTASQRLLWSHRLLRDFAMPQAAGLAQANVAPLLQIYGSYRQAALPEAFLASLSVATLLGVLLVVQVYITRRTRRLVNLPLAAATLVTACLLAAVAASTVAEREDVRSAKADCYDSLYPLYAARADAAAMNADVLLWMLAPDARAASATSFEAAKDRLLSVDLQNAQDGAAYLAALDQARAEEAAGNSARALRTVPHAHGLLADELANITFGVAERDPATQAVVSLAGVLRVSAQVRQLMEEGQDIAATTLRETDGDAAFRALDGAIARTATVNQAAFDSHIADARRLLGWTPLAACVGLLLAAALAVAGLWQRLAEYR